MEKKSPKKSKNSNNLKLKKKYKGRIKSKKRKILKKNSKSIAVHKNVGFFSKLFGLEENKKKNRLTHEQRMEKLKKQRQIILAKKRKRIELKKQKAERKDLLRKQKKLEREKKRHLVEEKIRLKKQKRLDKIKMKNEEKRKIEEAKRLAEKVKKEEMQKDVQALKDFENQKKRLAEEIKRKELQKDREGTDKFQNEQKKIKQMELKRDKEATKKFELDQKRIMEKEKVIDLAIAKKFEEKQKIIEEVKLKPRLNTSINQKSSVKRGGFFSWLGFGEKKINAEKSVEASSKHKSDSNSKSLSRSATKLHSRGVKLKKIKPAMVKSELVSKIENPKIKQVSKIVTKKVVSTKSSPLIKEVVSTKSSPLIKEDKKFEKNGHLIMPKKTKFNPGYVKTYIPGFDGLINPGIPAGAAILVEGGPGSGKTIFCLEVAKNMCARGKKVLYMSFEEPEYRLKHHMKSFGTDVDKYEKEGTLYIKRFNALDIARSVEALLSEAKKELLIDVQPVLIPKDFEPEIVLVDSLTSIGSAFTGEENRFRIYMEQLFRYLESHDITSFLIRETSNPTHIGRSFVEKAEAVSFLSDGIISVYNVFMETGKRKRALEVIKMRGTNIDRKIVECDIIGGKGIIVYPNKVLKGNYQLT